MLYLIIHQDIYIKNKESAKINIIITINSILLIILIMIVIQTFSNLITILIFKIQKYSNKFSYKTAAQKFKKI
jgi:hypothetical protein